MFVLQASAFFGLTSLSACGKIRRNLFFGGTSLEKNSDYRTGKPIAPTLDSVKNIANAMNIPIDDLLKMLDDEQEFNLREEKIYNIYYTL